MAGRNRNLLSQLLKAWTQDHTNDYIIPDPDKTDKGIEKTQSHFSWLIQEKKAGVDLLSLLDRLELFMDQANYKKGLDGCYCAKCQNFYQFAEANQSDGTLICYTCRQRGY